MHTRGHWGIAYLCCLESLELLLPPGEVFTHTLQACVSCAHFLVRRVRPAIK